MADNHPFPVSEEEVVEEDHLSSHQEEEVEEEILHLEVGEEEILSQEEVVEGEILHPAEAEDIRPITMILQNQGELVPQDRECLETIPFLLGRDKKILTNLTTDSGHRTSGPNKW